jgi:large subunit ribosomal protein L7Ae
MVSIYETVEKARKTGKIDKGVNEVTKAIERKTATLVVVAKDVEPKEIVAHIPILCKDKGIKFEEADSKEKLGIAAGINVPCSTIAVVSLVPEEKKKSAVKKKE